MYNSNNTIGTVKGIEALQKTKRAKKLFQEYQELNKEWEEWDDAVYKEANADNSRVFKETGLSDYNAREWGERLKNANLDSFKQKRLEVENKLGKIEKKLFNLGYEITFKRGKPVGIRKR